MPQRASPAQQATDAGATSSAPRLDAAPIPNKPGGGKKKATAIAAMIKAVVDGDLSFSEFRRMKQKQLNDLYPHAKRTVLQEARVQALSQLADLGYSDKAPT